MVPTKCDLYNSDNSYDVYTMFGNIFKKNNIDNHDVRLYLCDNCMHGFKTKQILDSIVWKFDEEYIEISWMDPDMIILIDAIFIELTMMFEIVDDNYKCKFLYCGNLYENLNEDLVNKLIKDTNGYGRFILLNGCGMARSQILLIKQSYDIDDEEYFESESRAHTV